MSSISGDSPANYSLPTGPAINDPSGVDSGESVKGATDSSSDSSKSTEALPEDLSTVTADPSVRERTMGELEQQGVSRQLLAEREQTTDTEATDSQSAQGAAAAKAKGHEARAMDAADTALNVTGGVASFLNQGASRKGSPSRGKGGKGLQAADIAASTAKLIKLESGHNAHQLEKKMLQEELSSGTLSPTERARLEEKIADLDEAITEDLASLKECKFDLALDGVDVVFSQVPGVSFVLSTISIVRSQKELSGKMQEFNQLLEQRSNTVRDIQAATQEASEGVNKDSTLSVLSMRLAVIEQKLSDTQGALMRGGVKQGARVATLVSTPLLLVAPHVGLIGLGAGAVTMFGTFVIDTKQSIQQKPVSISWGEFKADVGLHRKLKVLSKKRGEVQQEQAKQEAYKGELMDRVSVLGQSVTAYTGNQNIKVADLESRIATAKEKLRTATSPVERRQHTVQISTLTAELAEETSTQERVLDAYRGRIRTAYSKFEESVRVSDQLTSAMETLRQDIQGLKNRQAELEKGARDHSIGRALGQNKAAFEQSKAGLSSYLNDDEQRTQLQTLTGIPEEVLSVDRILDYVVA